MDLSPITFAQWQRDARRPTGKPVPAPATAAPAFARVDVVAAAPRPSAMTPAGSTTIRLVVRGVAGHEAALEGVDAPTAVQIVSLLLVPGR